MIFSQNFLKLWKGDFKFSKYQAPCSPSSLWTFWISLEFPASMHCRAYTIWESTPKTILVISLRSLCTSLLATTHDLCFAKKAWIDKDRITYIDLHIFARHPSMPYNNRRKGTHEAPQTSGTNMLTTTTCSNCRLQGHKYPQCGMKLRPELAMRRTKHKVTRLYFN